MAPASARDAAAAVLARDRPEGVEVLLLERHPGARFAPGAFAFPGGRVEADDAAPAAARLCRDLTPAEAARLLSDVDPPGRAIGFWVGALREVFEETGLLLARGRTGAPWPSPGTRAQAAAHRERCRRESHAFLDMLTEEELTLATDRMAYYTRWITPEERPIRYDARFFVAAVLTDALPEPDGAEVVSWRWLTPAAALAQHGSGQLALPCPTRQILGSLRSYPTTAALLEAARARTVRPVTPRIVREDGQERIVLPAGADAF